MPPSVRRPHLTLTLAGASKGAGHRQVVQERGAGLWGPLISFPTAEGIAEKAVLTATANVASTLSPCNLFTAL